MITCGKCKKGHGSVAEVRACYAYGDPEVTDLVANIMAPEAKASVQPGYYTVGNDEGRITVRLVPHWEKSEASKTLVLGYLRGSDNTSDYTQVAFVKRDGKVIFWKKYRGTPVEARLTWAMDLVKNDAKAGTDEYVKHSGNCWKCGRLLTTPESIDAGIGPVCAKGGAW